MNWILRYLIFLISCIRSFDSEENFKELGFLLERYFVLQFSVFLFVTKALKNVERTEELNCKCSS
jgi:hypothetical protein